MLRSLLVCLLACWHLSAFDSNVSSVVRGRMTADQRIALYQAALKETPGSAKAQAGLASAFLQKLRETTDFAYLNRASTIVDRMLAADPENYEGIRLRAEIESHRHNFPLVADLAGQLTRRNPSDAGAVGLLGDALMEMGRYSEAGDAYQQMLALGPNLASYNRVAYHRFVTGNGKEALDWMGMAVKAGGSSPENLAWCLVEFGDMLFKMGRTSDALIGYDRALQALPGYHRAYAGLGRAFLAAGQFRPAVENFEKAQSVIPLPEYALGLRSAFAAQSDSPAAAQQEKLLEVIYRLGVANGERGNRALALAYADLDLHLDRALALIRAEMETRKDVYTYDALSWVLFRAGKQKEAEDASRDAISLNTPEPLFFYHAGLIALAGGRKAGGSQLLKQALALNPEFAYPFAADAKRKLAQE